MASASVWYWVDAADEAEAAAEMADSVDLGGGGSSVSAKTSIDSYAKFCLEVLSWQIFREGKLRNGTNSTKTQHTSQVTTATSSSVSIVGAGRIK